MPAKRPAAGGRTKGTPPTARPPAAGSGSPLGGKGGAFPRRYARSTKRARLTPLPGEATARQLLSADQVTDGLRLDQEAVEALRACCSLRPPRNAASIVAAIKARLEYSQAKPKVEVQHGGTVYVVSDAGTGFDK